MISPVRVRSLHAIIRPVYRERGCVTLTMTAETVVTKHKIVVCNFEILLLF